MDTLSRRLRAFERGVRNRAVKAALREMARPIVAGVKSEAPKDLGLLKRSIKSKVLISKRTKDFVLRIGAENKRHKIVRAGRKRMKITKTVRRRLAASELSAATRWANPSKYSHLVALGTKHGVKATNYLRKGLAKGIGSARAAFVASMRESVAREARRAAGA